MDPKQILFLIPARGGSKGVPGKNIKLLGGKPLISYSIDVARAVSPASEICVSTDSEEIFQVAVRYGAKPPFMRPSELATDTASGQDVVKHALEFYAGKGVSFDAVVLLQPTSPFRRVDDVKACIDFFDSDTDMVVSVQKTKANPYFTLFEESKEGFLIKCKQGNFVRRQDVPEVYQLNGAVYVMNPQAVMKTAVSDFTRVRKHVMGDLESVDIDTPLDWAFAEFILQQKLWQVKY